MIDRVHNVAVVPSVSDQPAGRTTPAEAAESFGSFLKEAIENLNGQQAYAEQLGGQFIRGEAVDVHQLKIAGEKASLGLELTVQIRNKVVEAYQEIMRTQL
jgi:flagellar hook-basal body complex protein FliE